jgi:hypothetical protein
VVQVHLVRREGRLAPAGPADDGEDEVDEGDEEHRDRDQQRRASGSRLAAESKDCASTRPVALTAAADSMSPTSMDPESPMKIRAGLKLCGRKPRHAPASTAVTSAGALATSS